MNDVQVWKRLERKIAKLKKRGRTSVSVIDFHTLKLPVNQVERLLDEHFKTQQGEKK